MIRSLIAAAALAALSMNAAFAATAASAPAKAPAKKTAAKSAAKPAAKPAAPEAPLTDGQLAVAERVMTGTAECEFKQTVNVEKDVAPGHFKVSFGKMSFTMVPQETTTGAVVLVDKVKDVEWLQIPSKSMLLDQKSHHRLVTECQEAAQKTASN